MSNQSGLANVVVFVILFFPKKKGADEQFAAHRNRHDKFYVCVCVG